MNSIKLHLVAVLILLTTLAYGQVSVQTQQVSDPALVTQLAEDARLLASGVPQEPSCDEALDASIKKLIDADHNGILAVQYNLTMLKLAKKVVGSKSKSLEEYIKKDMARMIDLNSSNPATLQDLQKLYDGHADIHIKQTYDNIQNLKTSVNGLNYISGNRIANDDVASYMMYDAILTGDSSTFDRSDVAIAWLMSKAKQRLRSIASTKSVGLEMSDQVARYAGMVQDVNAASSSEIEGQIKTAERKIAAFMKTARDAFMKLNPECLDLNNPNNGCYKKDDERYSELLLQMQKVGDTAAKKMADEVRKNTRGLSDVKIGQEDLNACEGKPYKPREIGFKRYEFQMPNIPEFHGGAVRCTKMREHGHTHKHFPIQIDIKDKETCCKNKITEYKEKSIYAAIVVGFECRASYGIPYVAEVGIKGGLHAELGLIGKFTLDDKTCIEKTCGGIKAALRAELALYGEVLAGLAAVEGGIAWEPYAYGQICYKAEHWTADASYKFNRVMLYYKFSGGWGMASKSGNAIIHEDYTARNLLKYTF